MLAEREGFEPPVRITVQQISSLPHSTTLPSLRVAGGCTAREAADFITHRGSARAGNPLQAAHVGTQRRRHRDRAVGILVVLENRYQRAPDGEPGAV